MNHKKRAWSIRAFVVAFVVLTSLCWCPWAYGAVTGRMFHVPTWAVLAYVVAAALVVLEWVFLFASGLAVSDDQVRAIISELESPCPGDWAPAKEDD